jgi:ferrochelatase
MADSKTAVLLMAYGSPDRLEDVEPYYADIRGGRPMSAATLNELTEKYRRVGVPTPLLAVSRQLARDLETALNAGSQAPTYGVHLGMKHWTPRIGAAVEEIVRSGAKRLVTVILAPHYSRISTGGYRQRVEQALLATGSPIELDFVESWHLLPGYLDAVAGNVVDGLLEFPNPGDATVVFTAHSLPARILDEGDPYQDQLLATSRAIAERGRARRWVFSYQSQSRTGEPWLGPDLLETLEQLRKKGERQVLVAPVGFIADHLEILFDLDIETQERAGELGMALRRTRMLNADHRLVSALRDLVAGRLAAGRGATSGRLAGPA